MTSSWSFILQPSYHIFEAAWIHCTCSPCSLPPLVLHDFCMNASRQCTPVPSHLRCSSSGWLHSVTLTHAYSIISCGNISILYTHFFCAHFFRNTSKEYRKGLVCPLYCLHSDIGYGIDMISHVFTVLIVVKLSNTFIISLCFYMFYMLVTFTLCLHLKL